MDGKAVLMIVYRNKKMSVRGGAGWLSKREKKSNFISPVLVSNKTCLKTLSINLSSPHIKR
jgi:hypothetical protein